MLDFWGSNELECWLPLGLSRYGGLSPGLHLQEETTAEEVCLHMISFFYFHKQRDKERSSRIFYVIQSAHMSSSEYVLGINPSKLYTGDFQWEPTGERALLGKSTLLKALSGDKPDYLYLDNTYCNPYYSFPPREVVAQQVVNIIASHPLHVWTWRRGIHSLPPTAACRNLLPLPLPVASLLPVPLPSRRCRCLAVAAAA